MSEIYIHRDGQQLGPYSPNDVANHIKIGDLKRDDLAWCEGCAEWMPLTQIPGLKLPSATPPPPPPPPPPQVAASNTPETNALSSDTKDWLKAFSNKQISVVLALALVSAICVLSIIYVRKMRAKAGILKSAATTIMTLENAIKSYEIEYNRLPFLPDTKGGLPQGRTGIQRTKGWLLDSLTSKSRINPRAVIFFDPPHAIGHKEGIEKAYDGELVLLDPWGRPYYFMLDYDETPGIIDPSNSSKKLQKHIIIYSSGPDGNPETWEDNVANWK